MQISLNFVISFFQQKEARTSPQTVWLSRQHDLTKSLVSIANSWALSDFSPTNTLHVPYVSS